MKRQPTVTGSSMQNISFVSETYQTRNPKDCRLSVSIRRDGFSYLVQYKQSIEAYGYEVAPIDSIEASLKKFLAQEIFKQKFAAVTVIVVTHRFTLVPKNVYDDSIIKLYAYCNFPEMLTDSIISYETINTDSVVVFPIHSGLWSICRSTFKSQDVVSYVPQAAPMIEANCKKKGSRLYVQVENMFFTALLVVDKKVRFCNAFRFNSVNDFTYFIMYIFNQLHIDPLTVTVEFSGKITSNSPHFKAVQTFVKSVEMTENPFDLPKFPYMLFYNHYNIALCE